MRSVRIVLGFVEGTLPGLLLLGIVVLVSVDVFLRYVFGHPLSITSAAAAISIAWIIMLGSARAARKYQHIAIGALADRLGDRARTWHALAITLATIVILGTVMLTAAPYVLETANRMLPLSDLPRWVLTAAIPVGTALMIVHYAEDVVVIIGDLRRGTTRYLDEYRRQSALILDPTTSDSSATPEAQR